MAYIGAGITRFNTADELTVTGDAQIDGTTLVVDSTNNNVGIGTASPDGSSFSGSSSPVVNISGTRPLLILSETDSNTKNAWVALSGDEFFLGGTNTSTRFYTANAEAMTIDSSGNVGISNTTPSSFFAGARNLVVGSGSGTQGMTIYSGTSGAGKIQFADGTGSDAAKTAGGIRYDHSSNFMRFDTNDGTEAMRITADGSVAISRTAYTSISTDGYWLEGGSTKFLQVSSTGNGPLFLNRNGSDGGIINLYKSGSTVGSIGTINGDIFLGTSNTSVRFQDGSNAIIPVTSAGADRDNATDLGTSAQRFKDLYLSGGAYIGGTGSANKLDDYEEGTWDPQVGGSATYLAQAGIYTKIGNIVTVHFDIEINAIGTGSNTRITNFPFTSDNSTGVPLFAGCVSFFSGINSSNTFIGMYVINGTTECNFTGGTGNATTISQNGFAIFGNNARVIGSVTYRTT